MAIILAICILLVTANCYALNPQFTISHYRGPAAPPIDSRWDHGENLRISEEAANAGGYEKTQCEPITVPICKGAFYEYTRMPNILNHETQEEAGLEVKSNQ